MSLLSKYETITNHYFQISIKKIFYQKIKSRIKYYSNFLEYKIIIKLKSAYKLDTIDIKSWSANILHEERDKGINIQ